MLNLHAPFRFARSGDEEKVSSLGGKLPATLSGAVVAEESDRAIAVLFGEPSGETWVISSLRIAADRAGELTPRILGVADALAADEGLASVTLDLADLAPEIAALLDQEGFRPIQDSPVPGGRLRRSVIPQG